MNMLKKLAALALLLPVLAFASEEGYPLDKAPDRTDNLSALQHGAKLFVNYCLNCHSAVSMRYNRLKDLGLSEDQIQANLLFTHRQGRRSDENRIVCKRCKELVRRCPA